jgi:uncharacterized metal-binding protein YceD (DUF177 family)
MASFEIDIKDIESGGLSRTFAVSPLWLRDALVDSGFDVADGATDGSLEVRAQRSGDDVLVQARLRAALVASCARCLSDVVVSVDTPITALLTPMSKRPAFVDELELDPEDLDRDYFTGETIALDDFVREQAILEVPMKVLCPDPPGCAPIEIPAGVRAPEDFGRDEVDERLAPLLQLKRKLENNEE